MVREGGFLFLFFIGWRILSPWSPAMLTIVQGRRTVIKFYFNQHWHFHRQRQQTMRPELAFLLNFSAISPTWRIFFWAQPFHSPKIARIYMRKVVKNGTLAWREWRRLKLGSSQMFRGNTTASIDQFISDRDHIFLPQMSIKKGGAGGSKWRARGLRNRYLIFFSHSFWRLVLLFVKYFKQG